TIEPNTVFYSRPPKLPEHDACADMQLAAEETLITAGYEHYETSAFARPGRRCSHNLNYWEFGDYVGIGAGAHGKVSFPDRVTRHERIKQPRDYLAGTATLAREFSVPPEELPFEFMLDALHMVGVVGPVGRRMQHAARCQLPCHERGSLRLHQAPLVMALLRPRVGEEKMDRRDALVADHVLQHLHRVMADEAHIAELLA